MTQPHERIQYSDLDLSFTPHPLTGNVSPKINIEAIRQSVLNLLRLGPYDIPFQSNQLTNLRQTLFENITVVTKSGLEKRIDWVLKTFEKRIKVVSIDVAPLSTGDGLNITIVYKIRALDQEDTLTQLFHRVR
jgi:phage baseplate assembly protein W